MLIATTVKSVIDQEYDEITEEDLNEMISTLYKDISTYIQIEHIYGKYYQTEHARMITQIAIQIKPYFSTEISLDTIIIEILDKQDIHTLYFSGSASTIRGYSVFNHPAWDNTTSTHFSIISIFDFDSSLEQHDLLNDFSDRAYILVHLAEDQWFSHTESIEMNILFESGVNRYLTLQPPFSTKDIVQFY